MVIEAGGGRVTEDVSEATATTIVLAGDKDMEACRKSKGKKAPWAPAVDVQKKDFIKMCVLRHKLDRKTYKW